MATTKLTGILIKTGSIPTAALGGGVISASAQLATSLPVGTVSSSAQIDYNSITNKLSGVVSSSTQVPPLLPGGTVSSSGQVLLNTVSGTTFSNNAFYFPTDLRVEGNLTAQQIYTEYVSSSVIYESGSTKFGDTTDDVMSVTGSIRVLGGSISGSMTGMFSSSTQVDYNSITNKLSGVVSSSAQVQPLLPGGTVSSSGQVDITATTGYSTFSSSIATKNNVQDVSITALNTATSSYAINSTIQSQLAGVVSSSTQVKPLLPGGTVSSSAQVDHNATTNYSANRHIDHTAVNITAGAGLTGGGDISSTRTLTALYIPSTDARAVNNPPASASAGLYADFKANTTDGLVDGGTYHGVLTFRPYGSTSDFSGGPAYQKGFTENGNLYLRSGSLNTWSSWRKVAYETGSILGSSSFALTASYVTFANVDNKPTLVSSSAQTVTNLIGQTVTLSGSQFASIVSGSGTAYRLVVPVGTNLYAT
jgi:hypothetical protein